MAGMVAVGVGRRREFWTRQNDGGVLVTLRRRDGRSFEVEVLDPVTRAVHHFGSLRQFWKSLGRSAPVSVRRYLRPRGGDGNLLELFAEPEPPRLGIDLAARGHEVRKLMWAGFGHKILRAGYDPEDVLQEVFRGILARNIGKCPWDARKSSFGHYVHMVIGCVLTNYHRKQQSVRGSEVIGARGSGGEVGDAARVAVAVERTDGGLMDSLLGTLPVELRGPGRMALAVLADGGNHREAQRASGLSKERFEVLMTVVRAAAR